MTARFWLAIAVVAGCGGGKSGSDAPPPVKPALAKDAPRGLDLRLSNGKAGPPPVDHATLPPASKLDDKAVAQLVSRAKPLVADPADQQLFAMRPASQPPPRTGQVVTAAFPPAASRGAPPAANAAAGLHVTRWMPEGPVPLAPELTVTFDQPMVAITSQADAAAVTPVTLSPQPKGKWRWIGTRTILFDPDVRFPQATTYTVTIPAGTRSATGIALAAAKTFTFETPPPAVVSSWPTSGTQRLDVPMFIVFDQKIDPAAVLAKLHVTANGRPRTTRLLTTAEIAKSGPLSSLVAGAKADHQDDRWLAFRAKDALPADAQIDIELPPGTPSAEGPNPTKIAQRFTFRTYPPLKVVEAQCGWGSEGCRPQTGIRIELNNSLDVDAFDPSQISVSPPIADMRVYPQGSSLSIMGAKKPRTSYTVVVAPKLKDEFGQTLGAFDKRTFQVGDPEAAFYGPSETLVLDPAAPKRTLDFFTTAYTGLKVTLYKVNPTDYPAYVTWIGNRWQADKQGPPPGKKVFDDIVPVAPSTRLLAETQVELAPALDAQGLGHCIAIVEPAPWADKSPNNRAPQLISWVEATNLGLDAHNDQDALTVYASDLATGKPISGVEITEVMSNVSGASGADGVATLALALRDPMKSSFQYLIAKHGADVALLTESNGRWSPGWWYKQVPSVHLEAYTVDDRRLYRPGEEVSIAGWMRLVDQGKGGDLGMVDYVPSLAWTATDAQNNKVASGSTPVTSLGGFTLKLTLPKTPNLGRMEVTFVANGVPGKPSGYFRHTIRVEEFRRPEFEVTAHASDGPFLVGGAGDVTLDAKYFTGSPLPGAQVTWNVHANDTSFTPPNRDDYQFGAWSPWWGGGSEYDREGGFDDDVAYLGDRGSMGRDSWTFESKTDAIGEHVLHLDFLSMNPPGPMSVTTDATVTDVNRQTWTTSTSLIVHPAALYVGLKAHRPFVEQGKPYDLDVIGVDIDGKAVPGVKVAVTAERLTWKYEKGDYKTQRVDPQQCVVTTAAEAAQCHFATDKGGEYHVTATIADAKGRTSTSELGYTVSGGDEGPPSREVTQQTVKMLPDKKEYAPGNTAEILIAAPFYPAEGLVTWRRNGIIKVQRISIDGPTKVITVPIEDAMTPNLLVRVDLAGAAVRTNDKGIPDPALPKRVAFAVGAIDLAIPPRHRTLGVVVTPAAAKVSPADKTSVEVEVRDATGAPVNDADVQVIVVDESVLALAAAKFTSPIEAFYQHRPNATHDVSSRAQVKLSQPPKAAMPSDDPPPPPEEEDEDKNGESGGTGTAMALDEGKMGKKDSDRAEGQYKMKQEAADPQLARQQAIEQARNAGILGTTKLGNGAPVTPPETTAIAVRSNFNPLAAFVMVKTDAAGRASAEIAMPDNLTRYRVIAIAASGPKQFGKGESAITARLPLMVRPSPPRFLNFGDTFELPITVQNQTDAPMTVEVGIAATNLALTAGAGRSVVVPANDRVEVRFPAAAEMAGTARLQVVGAAGKVSDAAQLAIPVWTPATTEAFATYGTIDDGAIAQPIALPGKVIPQYGGLEVTASSTNVAALTDSFLYIVHYPFDCAEQRASRILSIASLRDVLEAFKVPDLPARAELEASMAADFDHLVKQQNDDGGFAYWERNRPSDPFLSVHVANAFARAKAKGYAVPPALIASSLRFLRDIESHYDPLWPIDIKRSTSAYALYVRKLLGDLDVAKAQKLLADAGGPENLPLEADGWLLSTLAGNAAAADQRKAIVRHAINKVSETAGAANFTTGYSDGAYLLLASDRRVDAVMLEALILEQPDLDLIPKIVTGLLGNRKDGRWLNTNVNSFALVALELYFRTYEKVTPSFVARMWLGADYAGDLAFRGRSTKSFQLDVAMRDVVTHDKQNLTIQKDGAGRMYYRIGMRYAPASFDVAAADYGFVVERTYEPVDDPKDVVRAADGAWHVKAGARVRVRIKMVNENRRYQVALVDPLPAGLEILNPELAGTAPIKPRAADKDEDRTGRDGDGDRYWWWYGPWYSHQNLRDERAEAFTEELWEGVHAYDYVARATTPGNFVVPPPKAEEMYMPETFGRGASDRMIVE